MSERKKAMVPLAEMRQAFAEYVYAEGCACCRDVDGHAVAAARIAKLLKVPKYADGSGHDFAKFRHTRGTQP